MTKPAVAFFSLLPIQMAVALMLGAVSVSGFAPDTLFFLPLLALAALFLLWSRASSRKAAAYTGFAFNNERGQAQFKSNNMAPTLNLT